MGIVYLAEHPLIGKKIALKVIHRDLAQNREVIQRFFQEAKAVNKIGHEHIVSVHDFGQSEQGDHFYIMEYIDGITLAKVLATDTVMSSARALHVGAQIAAGLAAAHATGIIHRDLKPDNIMLMRRGRTDDYVKILDFGLAKVFSGGGTALTAAGVILGTPQYMSPEACESKRDVDHRTDIYALGVLLFQMLTGRVPFDGESMGAILIKQVTTLPPPLRGFNSAIAPSVEQIVLRCLAKKPDDRFATMAALREALLAPDEYLASLPAMSPARSLAPGEAGIDVAAVLANVEKRMAERSARPVAAAIGLPLPAPMPSMISDQATMIAVPVKNPSGISSTEPAKPNVAVNQTMVLAEPLPTPAKPRRGWIALVAILVVGVGVGLVAGFASKKNTDVSSHSVPSIAADAAPVSDSNVRVPDTALAIAASIDAGVMVSPQDGQLADAAAPNPSDAQHADAAIVGVAWTVESEPAGADIVVDGSVVGKTPMSLATVGAGAVITVRLRGYAQERRTLGDSSTPLKIVLKKLRMPPHTPGSNHLGDGLMKPGDL
jgi:eukaryotic-like serine/threonine-protein kinase